MHNRVFSSLRGAPRERVSRRPLVVVLLVTLLQLAPSRSAAAPGDVVWNKTYEDHVSGPLAMTGDGAIVAQYGDSAAAMFDPDGGLLWATALPDERLAPGFAPMVSGDRLIVVGRENVYALNLQGDILWSHKPANPIYSDLNARNDGSIYFTTRDSQGRVRLELLGGDGTPYYWQPEGNGAYSVLATDVDGSIITRHERFGPDFNRLPGTPAFPDGFLALDGEGGAYFKTDSMVIHVDRTGSVLAEHGDVLNVNWVSGIVMNENGDVFLSNAPVTLMAFHNTGETKWTFTSSDARPGLPSVTANGSLLTFASVDGVRGYLIALDADTGAENWRTSVLNGGAGPSPLVGPDGDVYLAAWENGLYRVEGDGSGPALSAWPMAGANPGRSGTLEWSPTAPPAQPLQVPTASDGFADKIVVGWDPIPEAAYYELWRSEENDLAGAARVEHPLILGKLYTDRSVVPGINYYYWLRAVNPAGTGPFSDSVAGLRRLPTEEGELIAERVIDVDGSQPPFLVDDNDSIRAFTGDGRVVGLSRDLVPEFEERIFVFGEARFATAAILNAEGDFAVGYDTGVWDYPGPDAYGEVVVFDRHGIIRTSTRLPGVFPGHGPVAVSADGHFHVATVLNEFLDGQITYLHTLSPTGELVRSREVPGKIIHSLTVDVDSNLVAGWRDGSVSWFEESGNVFGRVVLPFEYASLMPRPDGGSLAYNGAMSFAYLNHDGTIRWTGNRGAGRFWFQANNAGSAGDGVLVHASDQAGGPITTYNVQDGGTLPAGKTPRLSVLGRFEWLSDEGLVTADHALELWDASMSSPLHQVPLAPTPLERRLIQVLPNGRLIAAENPLRIYNTHLELPPGTTPLRDFKNRNRATESTIVLPDPPHSISVDSTESQGYLRLTWEGDFNARFYEVWRGETDDPADATLIADNLFGRRTYKDYSAQPSQTHFYWVRAKNHLGTSGFSGGGSGVREDPTEGSVWDIHSLPGFSTVPPALDHDGNVYLSINALSSDHTGNGGGGMLSLDASGNRRWFFPSDRVLSPASISADNRVHFEDRSGVLYAINGEGEEVWRLQTSDERFGFEAQHPSVSPSIFANGDLSVIDIVRGNTMLRRLSADGDVLQETMIFAPLGQSPVIGPSGSIYLASAQGTVLAYDKNGDHLWTVKYDNASVDFGGPLSVQADETVWLHDSRNRKLRKITADGVVSSSAEGFVGEGGAPLIRSAEGAVLVDSWGHLAAFDRDGDLLWSLDFDEQILGSQLLDSGLSLTALRNGRLVAVTADGMVEWETDLGRQISAMPAVSAEGVAFVPTADAHLVAVYVGKPADTAVWPQNSQNPQHTGRLDAQPLAPSTPPAIHAQAERHHDRIELFWDQQPGVHYHRVWRSLTEDFSSAYLVADRVTGTHEWTDELIPAGVPFYYWIEAMGVDGVLRLGESAVHVRRAPQTGDLLAQHEMENPDLFPSYQIAGRTDDVVIVARVINSRSVLTWLDESFEVIAATVLAGQVASGLVVNSANQVLYVLHPADQANTKSLLYRAEPGGPPELLAEFDRFYFPRTLAVAGDDTLFIQAIDDSAEEQSVFSWSAGGGLVRLYNGPESDHLGQMLLLPDSRFVLSESPRTLRMFDQTGRELWRNTYQLFEPRATSLLVSPQGFITGIFGKQVFHIDLASGSESHRTSVHLGHHPGIDPLGRLWIASEGGVLVGSPTGAVAGRIPDIEPATRPVITSAGEVIYGMQDGTVRAYGLDLRERWRSLEGETRAPRELMVLPSGGIIVKQARKLMKLAGFSASAPGLWQGERGNYQGHNRVPGLLDVRSNVEEVDGEQSRLVVDVEAIFEEGTLEEVELTYGDAPLTTLEAPPFKTTFPFDGAEIQQLRIEARFIDPEFVIHARRFVSPPSAKIELDVDGADLMVLGELNPDNLETLMWSVDLMHWEPFQHVAVDGNSKFRHLAPGWAEAQSRVFFKKNGTRVTPLLDWKN